jgi:protein-L-isoaspartate(D-aspartate) O-methyltransferase
MPPELDATRQRMVARQLRARGIDDERVLEAMARVPRELFVPDGLRRHAYDDAALPIGAGQTISQPYMVARICSELELRGVERVLDVGTGSGYQAAVLAELAEEVHSIERIPVLAERAREALAAAGYGGRVHVHVGDGTRGLPEHAPFDAIAVAAAAPGLPPSLYEQLAPFGRLVVPVGDWLGQLLEVVVRTPTGPAVSRSVPCRFVPLVGAEGFGADTGEAPPALVRARARVRGRVQGVGFRVAARARAASLGLGGSVRNLPDGSVEVVLEGAPEPVESMLDWCGRGPSGARVDAVDVAFEAPEGVDGFAAI